MKSKKELIQRRLKIIIGQVEGISKMIDNESECVDIINQMKAIKNSFATLSGEIVEASLEKCTSNQIFQKDIDKILSIVKTFSKF
jgi:DNA-binding FrmR family transcriptional regulator